VQFGRDARKGKGESYARFLIVREETVLSIPPHREKKKRGRDNATVTELIVGGEKRGYSSEKKRARVPSSFYSKRKKG